MIAEKLLDARNRISAACHRCGRKPEDVLLVAVTKTFGSEVVRSAFAAGQRDFGENYVQELQAKRTDLDLPDIRWHFIGHLQTNKVKHLVGNVHLIHSVDNERVAREIHRQAERANCTVDILVEVHSTDEATKFGVPPDRCLALIRDISKLPRVRVCGLMTMGPFSENPDDSRPAFRGLRELAGRIEAEGIEGVSMRHLSMGMTHDFEVAIEEGATVVRLGTALFGQRTKAPHDITEGEL